LLKKAVTTSEVRHRLDPESDRIALYLRLTGVLRRRIESGEWAQGERLPSIEALCQEYDLARNTVRQALQLLKSDGLIGGGRGLGTFVLKPSRQPVPGHALKQAISDPLNLGADQSIEIIERRRKVMVPESLRRGLRVHKDYTEVRKIHRFRGEPFALMDIYIASPVYERFPRGRDGSIKIARLLRESGVRIADSRLEITTRHPDPETAKLLEYSMTGSLVCMRRWRTDAQGRIVTAGTYLYRGDLFVLDIAEPFAGLGASRTDVVPRARRR
jgi:GntR family transcriptional regulator